jgi:hypothetical protein
MAMTERRLMKLASQHHHFHRQEKDAEAEKKKIAAKVIPELKERGIKALEALGWRITHVEQFFTKYDVDKAERILDEDVFDSITKRVIDPDLLAAAVTEGTVKPKQLARFAKREPKSSYIICTPVGTPEGE